MKEKQKIEEEDENKEEADLYTSRSLRRKKDGWKAVI